MLSNKAVDEIIKSKDEVISFLKSEIERLREEVTREKLRADNAVDVLLVKNNSFEIMPEKNIDLQKKVEDKLLDVSDEEKKEIINELSEVGNF